MFCIKASFSSEIPSELESIIKIIPYTGDDSWIEKTVQAAIECLKGDNFPESGEDCGFCKYRESVKDFEK